MNAGLKDTLIRTARTFLQAALGVVIANGLDLTTRDLSTLKAAAVAGIIAAVTLAHGLLETYTPVPSTKGPGDLE